MLRQIATNNSLKDVFDIMRDKFGLDRISVNRGGKLTGDFRCDGMSGIPDPKSK